MEKRALGNSNMQISRLGLGSWAIGGDTGEWGWGKQSEKNSIDTIHAALEAGINWIDTAPAYGMGNAEKVIHKALKQTSHKPYIFTKCGLCWNPGETELFNRISRASIQEEIENSLSRLGVEVIDLYQVHWPLPEKYIEEAWQTLVDLQTQGKIRHIGVSNFSAQQMERISAIAPITSNQLAYNLLNREIEKDILPYCLEHYIGCINHSTLASGLLSGAMNKARFAQLDPRDWRHKNDHFREPQFSKNLNFVDNLKKIAAEKSCPVAQLSIAWTLAHPATTGTIIGARTTTQLAGLLGAADIKITPEDHTRLTALRETIQPEPA